ncbi:MAG: hypothetical protein ACM3SW_09125 [Actinomycetota bacterium]
MRGIRVFFGIVLLLLCAGELFQVFSQQKVAPPQTPIAYDNSSQEKVQGKIQEVKEYACPVTGATGFHITVKTTEGVVEVHLAPAKFLKEYEISLKPGEDVTVIGAKATVDGKPAVLAKTVTVGRDTFTFRDDKGKPLW